MKHPLQHLIDAPLANAAKINVPLGKRPTRHSPPLQYADEIGGKVSDAELSERKAKAADDKLSALYDYYAGTNLPIERIAAHVGVSVDESAQVHHSAP